MIETRSLGSNGPHIGRIGYGAMGLEGWYGYSDDEQAVRTIQRALDLGASMIDTADAYGNGHNETLVARAIKDRRHDAFIATKCGIVFDGDETGSDYSTGWGYTLKVNGKGNYLQKAVDASLKRLGVDTIDLWYLHYADPQTPIEETFMAMSKAVELGKVRYLGLSNVNADLVRRAHAIHPVTALQYEYSLWRREAETTLLPTLRELGIALVAWSPLGNGFLAHHEQEIGEYDIRRNNPRFAKGNLMQNQQNFAPLLQVARELDITPAQLALAWILHQGNDIFPIPGTRRPDRVDENLQAAHIQLDTNTIERINSIAQPGLAAGATLV